VTEGSSAHLTRVDLAIVAFVRKLTRTPGAMSGPDVAALRACALTDREIYDVTSIVGLFSYLNRLALGLGLPLESNWRELAPDVSSHR
jgi:alkylhydroperoxidase family enzyme